MYALFKVNGSYAIRELTDNLKKLLEEDNRQYTVHKSEDDAVLVVAKYAAKEIVYSVSSRKRSETIGGDPTKISEYNIKDRIASMEDQERAKELASAEAAARNMTPDELLNTWRTKSANLAAAVTSIAAHTAEAINEINNSNTTNEINKVVEKFSNA